MTELNLAHKKNASFNDAGVQFVWDATSISMAQTCLRKYKYSMIDGWHPRTKSVHLLFGGWFATALEHYYKHVAVGMTSADALYEIVREALIATWEYAPQEEEVLGGPGVNVQKRLEGGAPWRSDHASKTRESLIRTIVWYVDQFEHDAIEVVKLADGRPAVELSFKLPVDNGIFFAGHLDRLVTYAGDTYVMDQKTTQSTISKYFFDGFKPSTQMSMYSFAGQAIWQAPVKGVIIDGAQIAVGFTRFERGFTFRSAGELEEWYNDALFWIATAQLATSEDHFPMNPASCGNYGGCQYRHVCSRDPSVRQSFLAADFVKGPTWDPMEIR